MELTEQEKAILHNFRLLESKRVKDDLEFQVGLMKRTQEALKIDYGLVDIVEPSPLYADRRAVPVGSLMEVVNA